MRKLFYLGFCLMLAMGVGCAITDYALITDNDQLKAGAPGGAVVNTNGKAHIVETSQWAFIVGSQNEEWIDFVDQDQNGDRVLTAYVNLSTPGDGDATFHDDDYCNPDWTGCAAWTAPDPEVGDVDSFDGSQNLNCIISSGFSVLVSTGRATECGRGSINQMSMTERLALMSQGDFGYHDGQAGLYFNLSPATSTMIVNGAAFALPNATVFMGEKGHSFIDASNPLIAQYVRQVAKVAPTGSVISDFQLIHNGITVIGGQGFAKVGDLNKMAATLW